MIDLTPLEVRKKKGDFRRQLRGYDAGQVDDFLDVVADRLDQVVRDNIGLNERVARLEQQVTEFRDRERAMTEALVTAQEMRDQMRSQVAKEVELAKRQAVQDADHIRAEAVHEVEREEDNLQRLRQRQRQLLQSFRAFLERELSDLVVFSKALDFDESVPEAEAPRSRRPTGRGRAAGRGAAPAVRDEDEAEAEPEAAPIGRPDALTTGAAAMAALTGGLTGRAAERDRAAAPAEVPLARPFEPPRAEPAPVPPEPRASALAPPPPAVEAEDEEWPPIEEPPSVRRAAESFPREGGRAVDPFGEPLPPAVPEADALAAVLGEVPPAIEDRPEPVEAPLRAPPVAGRPAEAESLKGVSEEEFGVLLTGWGEDRRAAPRPGIASPVAEPEPAVPPQSDEEFLDDLLLAEAELVLSDEDVLEEPVDARALEEVGGDMGEDEFLFDEDLLVEETSSDELLPGDQSVDLGLLSDSDELASLSLDDLGLPPLPTVPDADAFGSSGLTLRPLSAEEEAPDVPRERGRNDDDDMFSSLFGKPR